MTTPLIRQLKKQLPNTKIHYMVGMHASKVLENNPNIDRLITFNENVFVKKRFFGLLKLILKIRKENYDIIFVLDKHWIFNLLSALARIPIRLGFDRLGREGLFLTHEVYYGPVRHEIYYYLDLLKALTGKANYKDHKMDLFLTANEKRFAEQYWKKHNLTRKKVVAIAPGGGVNPAQSLNIKLWPAERYTELIRTLLEKDYKTILIGDRSDKKIGLEIIHRVKTLSLIGRTTIKQAAAIMEKSNVIVCNDSGPMHIAAAVNKNIISLFGPTDPRRLAPLWEQSRYLWKEKKPCYDVYGRSKTCTGEEIKKIRVEDVLKCIK